MKKITFQITDSLRAKLGIADNADDTAIAQSIVDTAERSARVTAELATEKQTTARLQKELNDIKAGASAAANKELLDKAGESGKVSNELRAQLEKDYADNTEGLKKVLEGIGAYVSVTQVIEKGKETTAAKYAGKSWDELMESNQMEAFKKDCPAAYKALYEETFK